MSTKKVVELMQKMGNYPNNFLNEIKGSTENNAPMVSLNELNAKSLIDKHSKEGYVIVSPCKGAEFFGIDKENKQKLAELNKDRIKEFINILKSTGFSYTPVYGGFIENKDTDAEESVYERSFQDLPVMGMKSRIILSNRKMFCTNPECSRTTFAEPFPFIGPKAKKSNRLIEKIVDVSLNVSSLNAADILKNGIADVEKSTICNLFKKSC